MGSSVADISSCGVKSPNLLLAVFDSRTLKQITVPGSYLQCGPAGQPFYSFAVDPTTPGTQAPDTLDNFNTSAARRAQLLDFISKVPDGAYVALLSANRVRYADPNRWRAARQRVHFLG